MKSAKSSGQPRKLKNVLLVRRVSGNSMLPFLRPGNIILASSLANVAIGKVVIILDDGIEKIKRVDKIDGRKVFLLGDNPNSSKDSRHFGWLPSSRILASVIWPKS